MHAPEGKSNVEVLTVCSSDYANWGITHEEVQSGAYRKNPKYRDIKQRLEDGMVNRLEAQIPGLSKHICFKESSTPFTHTRFTHGGTAYGLAATPQQFMQNRPGFTGPLKNLFFCGHSTKSGHGIAGAMEGGARSAKIVLNYL